MGKVKHHKEAHNHEAKEHHVHHHPPKRGFFGSFLGRLVEFLREAVKAPEHKDDQELNNSVASSESGAKSEPISQLVSGDGIIITAEQPAEVEAKQPVLSMPDEIDEDALRSVEREKTREQIQEYISTNLNKAVSKWKETGDMDVHLELPVPLRDKIKNFISKVKVKSAPLSDRLKKGLDEVMHKVASRVKRAEESGKKINPDVVVRQEWKKVLDKMSNVSKASERDEIEKIYKQLLDK